MSDSSHNPWWETIAVFLAIISLWPWVFHVNALWAQIPMYVMLGVMVLVFVLRLRRFVAYTRGPSGREDRS